MRLRVYNIRATVGQKVKRANARLHFRAKQINKSTIFLYVQKSTDNCYLIPVENKTSSFISEQKNKRLKHFLKLRIRKNIERFSTQEKKNKTSFMFR